MANEHYTIVGNKLVYENGIQLPEVVLPRDVYILEGACRSNRLEWQGFEALFEDGKWTIYVQTHSGLKKVTTVETLGQAWLFLNNWSQ